MEASWRLLEASWRVLEASWRLLEALGALLGGGGALGGWGEGVAGGAGAERTGSEGGDFPFLGGPLISNTYCNRTENKQTGEQESK